MENLNKKEEIKSSINKYDENYEIEISPIVAGVLLLILSVALYFYGLTNKQGPADDEKHFRLLENIQLFGGLAIRILVAVWVYKIADSKNRHSAWTILAFFIPSVTLIIIGFKKKLNLKK